ncbi:TORTIFOLIA1-like protein 2 isoform X2 [Macadamia integrifolia]|uniref:TORTIFOLIA1-like protein 2 isoform X2 n=1 Tax=Macadamia integrifolia TaxID=60698 RepID=UPI001C4F273D|nr:TORTIFOLIA1-like protein 2 isoform X2 [Macadamia integrifolia]
MKMRTHLKGKGTPRVNTQKAIFELKHRVVLSLNKLADRDTYQIGVEELEKTAEGLTPEGIAPFLSCILDTEAEQKSAVRKECIRIMGTLVHFHEGLLAPHVGKMVASIVKRLKDPDSVVRDACVETVGVLALEMCNSGGESDGAFVVLVKPLFEALGEQNRQVQSGSSLCLAKVIDNTNEPPVPLLLRMLPRVIKLLKNPHFIAKPAVIELIRSIIQAGGAATQNALSDALTSIQEALKSSDWTARKSASVTLGGIAGNGGSLLGPFKASCISSLESCRFDKVKPVRDSVLQALQYWKSLPGPISPEPSEAGSSTKENFCGVDSGLTRVSDCSWKTIGLKKVGTSSLKKRVPLTVQRTCSNNVENPKQSKANDWSIDITVPKTQSISLVDAHNEESEGSTVTKTCERIDRTVAEMRDIGYDYASVDEKPECSSVSNLVTDNLETKCVTVANDGLEEGGLINSVRMNQMPVVEANHMQHITYSERMQECRSLDSTVTELSLRGLQGCCSGRANEMAFVRKQLLEIENKQSNLMDMLQEFMGSTLGSLSMLQSKVLGLEDAVDKIAQDFHRFSYTNMATSKILKKSQSVSSSPRLSTCSPRPSVDIDNRQPSQLSIRSREFWEEAAIGKGRSNTVDMWRDPTMNMFKNLTAKGVQQSFGHAPQSCQTRKNEGLHPALVGKVDASQNSVESKCSLWKHVKDFLFVGDLDSAFVEVLCSGDDLVLIELLDKTGPILESLSHETTREILSTLASLFLDQRFLDSIIPWLQQVVDLSTTRGPDCLGLSMKAKREFLSALQEAAGMDFLNPVKRRSITQYAVKLQQIWGDPRRWRGLDTAKLIRHLDV